MSKSSAKSLLPLIPNASLACATLGGVMGQFVMGIAAHHDGSVLGLVLALVFVLAGSAAMALFLSHRHLESRPRTEQVPVHGWLLTVGAALVASIAYGRFL